VTLSRLSRPEIKLTTEIRSTPRWRREPTQDGRALRRYKRRWTVERSISWLQNFRRLCIRW
jgi:transposase